MSLLRIGAVLGAILVLPACVVADGPYYGGGYGYAAPRYSYAAPVYRPAPVRHWGHHGGWRGHHGGWGGGWHRPVHYQAPVHRGFHPCRGWAC